MFTGEPPSLYTLYRQQAERQPDAAALRGLNAADLSYRGFIAHTERIAAALAGWGIGRGDRVIVQVPNGPEAFMLMIGVGACAVPLLMGSAAAEAEVDHFAGFVAPKAVLVFQGAENSARAVARQRGIRVIEIVPTPERGAGTFAFAEPPLQTAAPDFNGPDDLSLLVMTSGTTSRPRLVPKTQRALLKGATIQRIVDEAATGIRRPLHVFGYVPMQLAYGRVLTTAGLASGGSVTCVAGFDAEKILDWIDQFQPNYFSGLPVVLDQFATLAAQRPDFMARHQLAQFNTGGAAMPASTYEHLHRVFGIPVIKLYVMTEVDLIAFNVMTGDRMDETEGPVRSTENTRIVSSDGEPLPPNTLGEIVVRDPLFPGYWNNAEANADAFFGDWFRTGDEGRMDEEGRITIVGRVKEVINSGGAKISPAEVEAVLKQHPQVTDAAVFGLKNPEVGETVAAAVVGTVSERELRRFAAERLPFHKVPLRIIMVDSIPIGPSGKVTRNRLAEMLGLH